MGSDATMLQDTAERARAEGFLAPLVICNHRHGAQVIEQLAEMGLASATVLLEPFARNTAPVSVVAAEWAKRNAPGALVLLMPADHLMANAGGFREAVAHAARATKERIVTFGITPSGPETGYGYIQSGEPLYEGVFSVRRFVEKPEREVAETYLANGGYTWNAGIFLYHPAPFLGEANRLCRGLVEAATAALDTATDTGSGWLLGAAAFADCSAESIDVAVMEKTDKAAVMPCDVGWADIGSWSELWRHGARDEAGNHARGETVVLDSHGSLLWSDGPAISVVGVSDLIVVATAGHVLVLPKDRAQDVKKIVERWKTRS